MPPLHADLHLHTCYSGDSALSLEGIVDRCLEVGLNCLAITDHNTIEGALRLREMAPFRVIVAEEIKTSQGEISGFFLKEAVPPGLSPEETLAQIKAQGGLVGVSHPFDRLRRSTLSQAALCRLAPELDLIEVFNSRTTLKRHNERARAFALALDLPMIAGTDAHTAFELGTTYLEMADFNDTEEFKAALRQAKMITRRANPLVHLASYWARWQRRKAQHH